MKRDRKTGIGLRRWLRCLVIRIRWGQITEKVVGTAGHCVPAEIEYRDRKGKLIGFWAYGHWHPDYPYKG